jgi:hypothetical protein
VQLQYLAAAAKPVTQRPLRPHLSGCPALIYWKYLVGALTRATPQSDRTSGDTKKRAFEMAGASYREEIVNILTRKPQQVS